MASLEPHLQSDLGAGSQVRPQRARLFRSPTINTKIQRQDFLTKAGISMFQRRTCSTIRYPAFERRWRVWRRSRRQHHRRSRLSVHCQLLQGRGQALASRSARITAGATSTPTPPIRWTAASISIRSLTNLHSNPNSGDSFASMLLGLAEHGSPRHRQHRHRRATSTSQQYYFQDDWRVNNKLTVNLGLRYEFIPAPVEDTDRLGNLRDHARSADRQVSPGTLMWATTNPEVDPAHRRMPASLRKPAAMAAR